jgi:hypothetical protein
LTKSGPAKLLRQPDAVRGEDKMRYLTVALLLLLAGCGSSRQASNVEPRGFLGDYSKLTPGGKGEAALRYVDADARWARYDKLIIEPVEVWDAAQSRDISEQDMQTQANVLYDQLRLELGKDFELVDRPGPDTLRIEAALTGARAANQTMVVVSNVVPFAAIGTGAYEYVTGKPTYQGEAAAEVRMSDAQSGEILAAAVDERIGGRSLSSAENRWADVDNILAYWAQLVRYRLCQEQGRSNCEQPQTGGL